MSRIQILAVLLLSSTGVAAGEPARYVVHMLDPRVVATTEHTLPIEWRKQKTDIIATRALFKGEADHLLKLLKKELTTNTDVPFCGHHPGYAVQKLVDGKPTDSVTVCGLCHTWARSGGKNQLRVLSGDRSLAYLQSLLPPPHVFKEVAKPSDLADPFRNDTKPFYLVTEEDFPNDDG